MKKRIIALSLSLLFLGGISINTYAQVTNNVSITKVKDKDDKNKKKSKSKKECDTKKSCDTKKACCSHDFDGKSCSDKKTKDNKKDGSK
jgi:hypothetical protein